MVTAFRLRDVLCTLILLTGSVADAADALRGGKQEDHEVPPSVSAIPPSFTPQEKAALKEAAEILQFGFNPGSKGIKITDNIIQSSPIFDNALLQTYMESNFAAYEDALKVSISGSSVSSFSSDMDAKMNISGQARFLAGSVKANAAAEVGVSRKLTKQHVFNQERTLFNYGVLTLPNNPTLKTEIQGLMKKDVLTALQTISNLAEARSVVNYYGVGYFHQGFFGATFKMTSSVEKQSWINESLVSAKLSAEYKSLLGNTAKGSLSTSLRLESSGQNTLIEVKHEAIGGNSNLIADNDRWKESTRLHPVVTKYSVYPLYELLKPGTAARGFLEEAVMSRVNEISDGSPNFDIPIEKWVNFSRHAHSTRHFTGKSFSEENGYSGNVGPIVAIRCSGRYCDNKELDYVYDGNVFPFSWDDDNWTGSFSEENPAMICPQHKAVKEIHCSGRYCDNMKLKCSGFRDGYRIHHTNQVRSGYFSEEQGKRYCSDHGEYYLIGLQCRDSNCDDIEMICAAMMKRVLTTDIGIEDEVHVEVE